MHCTPSPKLKVLSFLKEPDKKSQVKMCWSPIRTIRIQQSEEHRQERQLPTKGMLKFIHYRDVSQYAHFHHLFLFTKITPQSSTIRRSTQTQRSDLTYHVPGCGTPTPL